MTGFEPQTSSAGSNLPTEAQPLPYRQNIFNMGQTQPLFVYFRSLLNAKTCIAQI